MIRAFLWMIFPSLLVAAPFEREVPENRDGIASYDGKRYDEASEFFKKGAERREEAPELAYNLGASLFKKGDLAGARKAWESALAKNPSPELKARIYDGLGAAAAAEQQYQEAARFFEQALRANPDRDTAANLEIVRRLLKQQQQQQQQQDQQKEKEQKEKNEKQKEQKQEDQKQDSKEQKDAQKEEQQAQQGQEEKKEEKQLQAAQAKKEESKKKDTEEGAAVLAPFRKRKDLQVTPFMLEKQGEPQGGQIW